MGDGYNNVQFSGNKVAFSISTDIKFDLGESQRKPSFIDLYREAKDRLEDKFKSNVVVTDYNPLKTDVFQIGVLFSENDNSINQKAWEQLTSMCMILKDNRLGYFKSKSRGLNDYEYNFQKYVLCSGDGVPWKVTSSEKRRTRKRPKNDLMVDVFFDKSNEGSLFDLSQRKFAEKQEHYQTIVQHLTHDKKFAYNYRKKKKLAEDQTIFLEDGKMVHRDKYEKYFRQTKLFETKKGVREERDLSTVVVRNDIIYESASINGDIIGEVKPSSELSTDSLNSRYLQIASYDAALHLQGDLLTPIVLLLPVIPCASEIYTMEKVRHLIDQKGGTREIGISFVSEISNLAKSIRDGEKDLQGRIENMRRTKQDTNRHEAELDILRQYNEFVSEIK